MDIRASDEDRQRAVASLERHTGEGRLTLDEFTTRVEAVYGARTLHDLAAVLSDLPAEPATEPTPKDHRELPLVFGVAIVALVLLVVVMALR
ncbi:DUF1707 SHOCT-like domain-containing protein [Mangrovihabitans endophyticus]|uniref:DUF1707 domain-containing protein n=1 Tax=Mangrovihabitans endophyticus TaxID=1751298 RepID=A0A8J3BYA4_9ACTN|nr:DUF1707 domain-containing protein [Mangrovihabitans endophyticus]GGK92487.1 hypothetical protein GCM10012284_27890 [Mangrovihabitans endophyticus]